MAAAEQSLLARVLAPIKAVLGRGAVYGSFMVAKQPARIRQVHVFPSECPALSKESLPSMSLCRQLVPRMRPSVLRASQAYVCMTLILLPGSQCTSHEALQPTPDRRDMSACAGHVLRARACAWGSAGPSALLPRGSCSAERAGGWAAQVLEQVYLNKDTLDDDLVASIARPATAASAAEVF